MIAPHEIPCPGPAAAFGAELRGRIPELRTERLVLRAPRLEDFPVYAEICAAPRAAGLGGPMDRAAAWADFVQVTVTWLLRGHGGWAMTDSGETVGFVLIGFEPGDMEPELGFLVTEAAEGRGVAAEAARAVLAHARGALGLATLVSYVDAANSRSAALARRLGARRDPAAEAALPADGTVTHVYRYDLTEGAAP